MKMLKNRVQSADQAPVRIQNNIVFEYSYQKSALSVFGAWQHERSQKGRTLLFFNQVCRWFKIPI
jgi:hypothetical protein